MCSICLEDFNKTIHLKISCSFCNHESCRTCAQTYLLSTAQEPHCMNCKHVWNREFVDSFCTRQFRNRDYKRHRENVLLDREKSRMPETQPHVTRRLEWKSLRTSYDYILGLMERIRRTDELSSNVKLFLLEAFGNLLQEIIENIRALVYGEVPISVNTKVNQKCPMEECRGFLLDDYSCGVCKVTFCEKCHEPNDDHECDPNTVKTIKLLKKDTRPCPSCNTPIHRIEGCAQMWCTQCHTAFDWRTGAVVTGRIHNPHYFEFKKRGREHADIPCGGRPTLEELTNAGATDKLMNVNATLFVMNRELMYKYGYTYGDNLQLRIHYMMGNMSEEEFKIQIQRRDKYNCKMRDIQDIYNMFIDSVSDILRQFVLDPSKVEVYTNDIDELLEYTNSVMARIRKRYVSRVPHNIML